jgi:hypothetical protein
LNRCFSRKSFPIRINRIWTPIVSLLNPYTKYIYNATYMPIKSL